MIRKFQKKPCIVEACQFDGSNVEELLRFGVTSRGAARIFVEEGQIYCAQASRNAIVHIGDYVCKNINEGFEIYPTSIFHKLYGSVEPNWIEMEPKEEE